MRKMLLALSGVATLALFGASQSLAAPASGSSIAAGLNEIGNIENVRTFCYNKKTGDFLHWGACRVVCNYYGESGQCRKVAW
jgi:hypothetical protein